MAEYWKIITAKPVEVRALFSAQIALRDSVNNGYSEATLLGKLNGIANLGTMLGVGFAASSTSYLASAFTSLKPSLGTAGKNALNAGVSGLSNMTTQTSSLSGDYELFEISFPFVDFVAGGKNIKFVQGNGTIVRAKIKGGSWVTM